MEGGFCPQRDISHHPCFYSSAGQHWGRVHLPVAPNCNIQCNFCNRLYDCPNESRPAVTRGILQPTDVLSYLAPLLKNRADISVAGIAGPGDPMCDPEQTLETVRILKSSYPGLLVCISTNGLNLTEYVDELAEYGVTHVTVTINAVDPLMGSRIYSGVTLNRRTYGGIEGAKLLWSRQREAVVKLKARGLVVKINTVVIPGLNSGHIDAIAEEAATLGADLMNCIPMIPLPDTPFSPLGEPSGAEMDRIRGLASRHIPQMYHCRRCRADAVGRLCLDERHLSLLDPASAGVGVEGNLQRLEKPTGRS